MAPCQEIVQHIAHHQWQIHDFTILYADFIQILKMIYVVIVSFRGGGRQVYYVLQSDASYVSVSNLSANLS